MAKHNFEHISSQTNEIINSQIEKTNSAITNGLITDKEAQYGYLTFLQGLNLSSEEVFNVYTNTTFSE